MAFIPKGHARPTMGGWDRWTIGERGEIPGEDGVWAAHGRGREFLASTKPTLVCVGLVRPTGNLDSAGNPPLNLEHHSSGHPSVLISKRHRSGPHSGGLRRSKSQWLPRFGQCGLQKPRSGWFGWSGQSADDWSSETGHGSGRPATWGEKEIFVF
jgi:hypothetical protein